MPLPDGRRIPVALSMRGAAGNDNSGTAFAAASRLNAAADKMAASAGAGARGKTEVHLHGNGADNAQVEERQDSDGNQRLDVWLDDNMAKAAGKQGSKFRAKMATVGRPMRR
ncbi:MAG: hypothetical protein J0I31_19225 [Rhizobiales bacterium]|nr:hypothetical protein [Hyphomicrobiales bacterium]